ncbi:autotransporter domain-containing esterase [Enterobacterales bacterium CwR94]|nr:autotransporter domain-containing esterase [Enterobacterales bacterium CwR94]
MKSWGIRSRLSLGAIAVAGALLTPFPAVSWDNLTVFGDSLSDGGNNGRYTWDGASRPLYNDILAERIHQSLQPSSQGGSNYAAGGAVAIPALNPEDNTQDQVAAYLRRHNGQADGNGLYIHWIGGNDLAAAALNPLAAIDIVDGSAFAAASQIRALQQAGAGTVMVPTVPNIGATPAILEGVIQVGLAAVADAALNAAFQSLNSASTPTAAARQQAIEQALSAAAGQASAIPAVREAIAQQLIQAWQALSSQASALTERYNQQEEAALAAAGGNIVRVDINGLFNEVIADPGQYGLSNTAGMACPPGVSAAVCTSATPGFASGQDFLFADRLHPGPATHALIADYMQSVLDAPVQVATLNQATFAMARDMRNSLDGRLQQQRVSNPEAGTLAVWGGYAGQHDDYKGNLAAGDGHATTHNLTLGADYQLTDAWLAGVLVSGSNDRQHPTSDFDYRQRGVLVSAYSQLTLFEQGWVNADLHYADLNFDNIDRRVRLGPATRSEQGETSGKQWGMRITSGWDFPVGERVTTGPVVQYALDYSRVGGYREQSDNSTAMRFNDQTAHSQVGAVGWRIDSKLGLVNPWAEVSYNHQFGDNTSRVSGGLKSTQTTFTREAATQDSNWVDVSVGAHMPLGDTLSAFASVSQTGGLSTGEQFMYNFGLSASF